jgi:hypothetical protein
MGTVKSATWVVALMVAGVVGMVVGACGSDSGGGSGNGADASLCNAQCDAKAQVQGCAPANTTTNCKQGCAYMARTARMGCGDKFNAYYKCSASAGFECGGGLGVTQKGGACGAELNALGKCNNPCEGADDSGACRSVDCPCPSGTIPVGGMDQSSGVCKCYNTTTCQQFCH